MNQHLSYKFKSAMNQNNEAQKPMVENISCILAESKQLGALYLGNVYGAQNPQILKQYGIRAVITSSAETKINHSFDDIPFHLKIEAHDKDDYYIIEHINDCIHFIEQNRKLTNVYVHCYAGVSRSSAIIAAYLMWKYRWPLDKTINFLVFKRIVVKPNEGFMRQLKEVEAKLNIQPQNSSKVPQIQQNQKERFMQNTVPSQQALLRQRITKGPQNAINTQSQMAWQDLNGMRQTYYVQEGQGGYTQVNARQNIANQRNVNPNRSITQPRPNQQKAVIKSNQNHEQIPIPKVLTKKPSLNQPPKETFYQDASLKKTLYNDYMSPQVMPKSPRMMNPNNPHKNSLGKLNTLTTMGSNSKFYTNKNGDGQGSIYATNTSTNGMNSSKKGYQSQQKSKTTSRCLIRPKDLPGYKNY